MRGDTGGAAAWGKVAVVLSQTRKPTQERRDTVDHGRLY
jgi:hypothetical protein